MSIFDPDISSVIVEMAENNKRIAEILTQALGHLSNRHGKISEAKEDIRQALELAKKNQGNKPE